MTKVRYDILKEAVNAYNKICDGTLLVLAEDGEGDNMGLTLSEGPSCTSIPLPPAILFNLRDGIAQIAISTSQRDERRIIRKLLKGTAELRKE